MGLDDAVYNAVTAIPRHRRKFALVLVLTLSSLYVLNKRRREALRSVERKTAPLPESAPLDDNNSGKGSKKRVGVDAQFVAQLRRLLPICIPGLASKEFALLASLAVVLIARTWLDIWFSAFNGVVVKSIVTRDWPLFFKNAFLLFGFMMWPMSVVNNSLKLLISKLALAFRTRLTRYAHSQYLQGITFYQVANLDTRIQNADQLLTQDIEKFSETLSHLYSDIAKPLVDIALFAYKLGESIGAEAPVLMLAYFASSGYLLKRISPSFGKFIAIEQGLEGQFRYSHSRIIAHSEEIAFYRGADQEKTVANATFQKIKEHLNRTYLLRFTNGIIDSVLVKYCATQLAFYILSRPVFGGIRQSGQEPTRAASDIMEEYSRNSGYLINLSQAVGRIVLAGRDLTRFAGYTSRVSDLMSVIEDVAAGRYQRTMFSSDTSDINNGKSDETTTKKGGAAVSEVRVIDCTRLGGVVEEQDGVIEFVDVPICTPSGDILVPSMSFRVVSGMNCLITGPNGCGKSSLFRILGGLWPQFGGRIVKPRQAQMFYVPQKPYLPQGTLRDQITYPSSRPATTPKEDDDLTDLLQTVHLGYLVEREGGWDAVHDWADVLSGGEKQRVAMARLFYHRPQFAILDECTSAVSIDVEGKMYTHAKALGITLFTVSHRPSLFPYHEYLLRFDGQGGYEFGQLVVLEGDAHHPFSFTTPKKAPQAMVSEGHDSFDGEEGDVEEEGDLFYSRD